MLYSLHSGGEILQERGRKGFARRRSGVERSPAQRTAHSTSGQPSFQRRRRSLRGLQSISIWRAIQR